MSTLTNDIALAAKAIRDGKLAAFATETVYGLGADATSDNAVARIFAAKQRPAFNPLIVHVPALENAQALGRFNDTALKLAAAFWPGPLTLVVPRTADCPVSLLASAGLGSLAIRVPGHTQARELLAMAGVPVVAPSANPSGRLSPTTAGHVVKGLGDKVDLILDGGQCRVGVESTVVGCLAKNPVLLRAGGLNRTDIEQVIGQPLIEAGSDDKAPVSPGMLISHYAPYAALRMDASEMRPGEALLAFGSSIPKHSGAMLNLSVNDDLVEAASNLFAMLHALDDGEADGIAVVPIPDTGLGVAINDRLRRAVKN